MTIKCLYFNLWQQITNYTTLIANTKWYYYKEKNKCLKYHSLLLVVWEKYKKTTKTNLYKYNGDTI